MASFDKRAALMRLMIYTYKRREDKNGTFSAQWLKVICETKGWMSNISWFLKLNRIFQFLTFLKSKWILHYANYEINLFVRKYFIKEIIKEIVNRAPLYLKLLNLENLKYNLVLSIVNSEDITLIWVFFRLQCGLL